MTEEQLEQIELKDCPFCSGKAIIIRHPGLNWDGKSGKDVNIGALHGTWYVGCPSQFFDHEDLTKHCEIHPSASWYGRLEDAIKDWNKRAETKIKKSGG